MIAPVRLSRRESIILASAIAVAVGAFAWRYLPYFSASRNDIGTDYAYFLPRLLAGDFWYAQNGLFSVPWSTAGFCGGLPFYPNPQSLYFSPAQWLSFVVNPLWAVRITILLYSAIGATGMAVLARRTFGTSLEGSLVAGVVFLFNGFYSHRMLIGHFTFAPFMLTPIVVLALAEESWLGAALLFALFVQSGMVVLFAPVVLAVAWIGLLLAIQGRVDGVRFAGWLALALVIATLLCAAKLSSGAAFVSQFPRDFYSTPGIPNVGSLFAAVLRVLFWHASGDITHEYVHQRVVLFQHEWEYGLGPFALILFVVALVFFVRWRPSTKSDEWDMRKALLVLLFLIPLALNFYTPGWNEFLHRLPILGQSQTLSRWFSFYVPVLSLLAAFAFDAIPFANYRSPAAIILCAATIGFHADEDRDRTGPESHIPHKGYEPKAVDEAWEDLHQTGRVPPVDHVGMLMKDGKADLVNGENLLAQSTSDMHCYEPLFGYRLQQFPQGTLHPGGALEIYDGKFNLKDPACFVFPHENSCKAGDPFAVADLPDAQALMTYKPERWNESPAQKAANVVNLLALIAVPIVFFARRRRAE